MASIIKKNKRVLIYYLMLLVVLLCISVKSSAQSSSHKISKCFTDNDFASLSNFFGEEVKVEINKSEELLSKAEAEKKLKNFFSKASITSLKMIHQGSSSSKFKFFIASISSPDNQYRTYVLYEEDGEKVYISEVRIEAEK